MSKQEPSGEVPDVDVTGQGIQIGTGNNQYNAWMPKPPLEPAAMRDLNPHVAVARLQQLSHDELVDFFARAKPDDVGEIIAAFLEVNKARVIATLGDINRSKATELIGTVCVDAVLRALPEAAQAIARKAASLRWADAGTLGLAELGYVRKYKGGRIFWSGDFGVRTTTGVIDDYWTANSHECDVATGDQETALPSRFGTHGIRQKFELGTVYSSEHGIFRVHDTGCYRDQDDSEGWLGFPVGEVEENGAFGKLQKFEGGTIFSYIAGGPKSFRIPREILDVLPGDRRWRATSGETSAVSSSRKEWSVVRFEVELEAGTFETAVYWDEKNKPVMVQPEVWNYYNKLGAEKSWLGFPTKQKVGSSSGPGAGQWLQHFEGGTICWRAGGDPVAIRKAVDDFIAQDFRLLTRLGFPVAEDQPVGTGGSDSVQFFEHGVVTCRDGKYEVWVRPDKEPEGPRPRYTPYARRGTTHPREDRDKP